MQRLSRFLDTVGWEIARFQPESTVVGAGRSMIALAQISLLVFTGTQYLFVPVLGEATAPKCGYGLEQVSIYCLSKGIISPGATSWLILVGLLIVLSGYRPRLTAPLHFWLTISISKSISLPDGGEAVALNVTLLLVLVCCADRRKWHWTRGHELGHDQSAITAVAWAAHWTLRLQMGYIYLNSALAKLPVDAWSDGSAVFYVLRGEAFGTAGPLRALLLTLTDFSAVALAMTWGAMLTETVLTFLLVSSSLRRQKFALLLAVALHAGIFVALGLWTFALVMLGGVTIATARAFEPSTPQKVSGTQQEVPVAHQAHAEPTVSSPNTAGTPAERRATSEAV